MNGNYVALIPAYKPSLYLLELLENLSHLGFKTVVVNDGSGLDYEKIFFDCSRYAEVLHHEKNQGKGSALKTGLRYIYKTYRADCIVVTVDADGQHLASDALKIVKLAESSPRSIVLGCRKLGKTAPLRSRFGNGITRFVFRCSTGRKVYDTQTGLRAFDGNMIPKMIIIEGERYEYEMNVLLRLAKENTTIVEQEIETIYLDNNASSHFDAVKDSARIYKEILKFSAASFVGFLTDYAAYSLLLLLGGGLTFSNTVARIISASVNFTLNRKFVFKSKGNLLLAVLKYIILALCILVGNTLVLNLLVNKLSVNPMIAKLITELLFFLISWIVQKTVVFKQKGDV